MNALTHEWIVKAEGDFRTAIREVQVEEGPNYDAVCFHSQQCAEKYLKAFLQERGVPFPKVHDLEVILELIVPLDFDFEGIRDALLLLNDYAVDIRYPGEMATYEEAREAVEAVKRVRSFIRRKLHLE